MAGTGAHGPLHDQSDPRLKPAQMGAMAAGFVAAALILRELLRATSRASNMSTPPHR